MSRQKKNKLTIYLIRLGFEDAESVLNLGNKDTRSFDFGSCGKLCIFRSPEKPPKWITGFFGDRIDSRDWLTSNASAVLVIPVIVGNGSRRLFALTFGYAGAWLKNEAIERRFGLKCVLNCVSSDSLRQIRKTLISGNARKTSEQMPRKAKVSEFSLDYEQDLLESVTAVGGSGTLLEGPITGSDSLAVSSSVKLEDIQDYLGEIYSIYQSDAYKENFSWIDHVAPVKDKGLISRLEGCAVEALCSGDESVWFAVPTVIDWETTAGFRFTPHGETFDDILVEDVLRALRAPLSDFAQLKNKKIYVVDSTNDEVRDRWLASRCLYGEVQLEGEQYCVTDGSWYKVDKTYSDEIKHDYDATAISDVVFPDYLNEYGGEGGYNTALADSSGGFLLMDNNNISFGGGRSQIELCDVLSSDGKLIHVKRYGGSSVMSHLFNQGLISMDLIKSEPSFVEKANQKIACIDCSGAFSISESSVSEVVYGIVTSDCARLPNIPFFSKVAFHHVKRRLKAMGVKVSIGGIRDIDKLKKKKRSDCD